MMLWLNVTWREAFCRHSSGVAPSKGLLEVLRFSSIPHENEQWSIARNTPAQNLSNGQVHSLRVRYVPGLIEVFVNGASVHRADTGYSTARCGEWIGGRGR